MQLIEITNGNAVLRNETALQIAEFERIAKDIKAKQDALKSAILSEMEAQGITRIETPEMNISYVAPYDKEQFDTKAFRKDHSDLYDEYVSMTPVKASIRIKVLRHE